MGNVNAREDGGGSSSGAEEGGVEGGGGGSEEGMAAPGGAHGVSVSSPDMMGQSPPHSPRATQSPLIFTPQVSSFSLSFCFRLILLLFWLLFS